MWPLRVRSRAWWLWAPTPTSMGHARDRTLSGHIVASGRFRALGIRTRRVAHACVVSPGLR
eukprot:scaffold3410_cov81-Phaeocystis_antarctica.AAC.1